MNRRWLLVAARAAARAAARVGPGEEGTPVGHRPDRRGPYIYKDDPATGRPFIGFEVELADTSRRSSAATSKSVAGRLGQAARTARQAGDGEKGIDIVLNGYEVRDDLKKKYAATVPYYVYRLSLDRPTRTTTTVDRLGRPARGEPRRSEVGVLGGSVAREY